MTYVKRAGWVAAALAAIVVAASAGDASAKGAPKEKDPPSACTGVKKDLDKAQKALDKAARTYEARDEALQKCEKKGTDCKKQKAKADAALKKAAKRKDAVCAK